MRITHSPSDWATQTARWEHDDDRYSAMVGQTGHTDPAYPGKHGWAYSLRYPGEHDGVVVERTFAEFGELIWSWDTDPLDVLHTLATFVYAWREAMAHDGSDNRDLFPEQCAEFLNVAEDFYMHTYRGEPD